MSTYLFYFIKYWIYKNFDRRESKLIELLLAKSFGRNEINYCCETKSEQIIKILMISFLCRLEFMHRCFSEKLLLK